MNLIKLINLAVLAWLVASPAIAGDLKSLSSHPDWPAWERRCFAKSLGYADNFPAGDIPADCTIPPRGKGRGNADLNAYNQRQLLVMLAEAAHADRLDHREFALHQLKNYYCVNEIGCEVYLQLLDRELLPLKKQKLRAETQYLIDLTLKTAAEFSPKIAKANPAPERHGLCADGSPAEAWLEHLYPLYCPMDRLELGTDDKSCDTPGSGPCFSEKAFEFALAMHSHQMLMSSSYLESAKHENVRDCQHPWQVTLTCGGHSKVVKKFNCIPMTAGERRVDCSPAG